MKYFRSNRRRFYRRRKAAPKRRIYRRKTGLKAMVNRMINRKIETKEYTQAVIASGLLYEQTGYVGLQSQCFSLIPNISPGTANGQRIGDQLSVTSLKYKGIIYLTAPGSNGHFVRIVVFSVKDYNADVMGSTLPSLECQNFFRNGATTGTVNGFSGNDTLAPINTDRLTVFYDKVHYLGTNVTPVNNTSGQIAGGPGAGRPFIKWAHNFAKSNKRWRFDENSTNPNLPTNQNLFVAYIVNEGSNVAGSSTTQIAQATTWVHMKYKDA